MAINARGMKPYETAGSLSTTASSNCARGDGQLSEKSGGVSTRRSEGGFCSSRRSQARKSGRSGSGATLT
eukprot:6896472-Pyramimonas_sp.AAC.1